MRNVTLALLTMALFSLTAVAQEPCLNEDTEIEVTGTIRIVNWRHENETPIESVLIDLDRPFCLMEAAHWDEAKQELVWLPEQQKTLQVTGGGHPSAPRLIHGQRVTLKAYLGAPGGTGWFLPYHILNIGGPSPYGI
jgi:hypothetical protein